MAQNNFHSSFSEDPAIQSRICVRCGKTADMRLELLGSSFQENGTFCLSCAEGLIHELRRRQAAFTRVEQLGDLFSAFANANAAQKAFLHSDASYEEAEGGIIFWEGHGWSSDGPFAGA